LQHNLLVGIASDFPTKSNTFLKPSSWSRVLLEKLIVTQIVKKFPAFYGIGKLITAFTKARHWYLSLAK